MKNTCLFFFTLFLFTTYAQEVETLSITPEGINGYLVREYEDKSAKDIYDLVKKWSQYHITNAEYSQNSDIENEYLSFRVNSVGKVQYKNKDKNYWGVDYNIEVRIKENRMRLDLEVLEFRPSGSSVRPLFIIGNGIHVTLFNKKGDPRTLYTSIRESLNKNLNDFANRIYGSVEGKKDYKKQDW